MSSNRLPHLLLCLIVFAAACARDEQSASVDSTDSKNQPSENEPVTPTEEDDSRSLEANEWRSLFDGHSLARWKLTPFDAPGDVTAQEGILTLGTGDDLTGVTATEKIPRIGYEIQLEAMRVEGGDFFCGLTFPFQDQFCTLIIGGWGGGVCGLSSIDGYDAANNETPSWRDFENGRWYRIRLEVRASSIRAWIDDEQIIEFDPRGRTLSVREEVEPSRPFGLSSWRTTAAVRNFRLRELPTTEVSE